MAQKTRSRSGGSDSDLVAMIIAVMLLPITIWILALFFPPHNVNTTNTVNSLDTADTTNSSDVYVEVSVFIGFMIGMVLLIGLGIPLLEAHDKAINEYKWYVCAPYSRAKKVHGEDVVAMLIALAPGIALAYTMMNITGLAKAIGQVALGWVIFAEFFALLFLGLIDPPFTDIVFSINAIMIAGAVGYVLLKANLAAAIAIIVVGGLIGIGFLTHYIDVALCKERD